MNQPGREEAIRARAYQLWETHGRVTGKELDHWLQAEREVSSNGDAAAKSLTAASTAASKAAKPAAKRKKPAAKPAKSRSKKNS